MASSEPQTGECRFTIQTYFCTHRSWQTSPRVKHMLSCFSSTTDGKKRCKHMAKEPQEVEIPALCKKCLVARERRSLPYRYVAKGKGKVEEKDVLDADVELEGLEKDIERAKIEKGTEDEEWVVMDGFQEEWVGTKWEWDYRKIEGEWEMVLVEAGLVGYSPPKDDKPVFDDDAELAKLFASGFDGIKVKDNDGELFDDGALKGIRRRKLNEEDEHADIHPHDSLAWEAARKAHEGHGDITAEEAEIESQEGIFEESEQEIEGEAEGHEHAEDHHE